MGHIVKPPVIHDRLFEASKCEYKTRHLIDGRIVQCDQRISLVAGYMADEVCNLSPFTFMHRDDVRWVMVALRQSTNHFKFWKYILIFFLNCNFNKMSIISFVVYDFSSPYGESCYRLMARTGQFIYLRTRGYLDIDRETNQVRSFVCVNSLVDEDEGKQLVKEMKKKFTIMIQETEISTNEPDVAAVENPVQLERAIISLITNLSHHGSISGNDMVASPETPQGSTDGHESDTNRSVKSPPLEIIPPKASTIKTSIVRSMDVVSTTAKTVYDPETDDKLKTNKTSRPSVLQRNTNAKTDIDDCSTQRINSTLSPATSSSTITSRLQIQSPQRSSLLSSPPLDVGDIKQEQPDSYEDRVPPLPTNAGYFEMNPYDTQQYMDDIASPIERKPFDFLGFDPIQAQQADESRFLTPETASQFKQYDTGDKNNGLNPNYPDTSNQASTIASLKRGRSNEDADSTSKRRFYTSTSESSLQETEYESKPSLSFQQTCIEQLIDPSLGKQAIH